MKDDLERKREDGVYKHRYIMWKINLPVNNKIFWRKGDEI
jgi:hypothetical protein